MKKIVVICLFCILTVRAAKAQKGNLFITSYDDTNQIVYVCNGTAQNYVPVQFAMVNLTPSIPITIDSTVPSGDTNVFFNFDTSRVSFVLGEFYGGGAVYAPNRVGQDTLHITVYYNGQYTDSASIICHARSSPKLAMYGYETPIADSVGPYGFGESFQGEVTDTMFDLMLAGIAPQYYIAGAPPSEDGGPGNEEVELRSCGGAIIDSIDTVGDFSEFSFDSLPSLPDTLHDDDNLIITYKFSPRVIDTLGVHHHYLIFHSTDGHYLTWSFQYWVYPNSSVSPIGESANGIRVFPNPATNALQILGGPSGTVRLFDLLGRERAEIRDDGSGATLDISKLEAGAYFLRIGNKSAKVEITH